MLGRKKKAAPKAAPKAASAPEADPFFVGANIAVDGVDYVVTRYLPGVFTVLTESEEWDDAVEVREVLEPPPPPPPLPPLRVLSRSELLAKLPPPETPNEAEEGPQGQTPSKRNKQ